MRSHHQSSAIQRKALIYAFGGKFSFELLRGCAGVFCLGPKYFILIGAVSFSLGIGSRFSERLSSPNAQNIGSSF